MANLLERIFESGEMDWSRLKALEAVSSTLNEFKFYPYGENNIYLGERVFHVTVLYKGAFIGTVYNHKVVFEKKRIRKFGHEEKIEIDKCYKKLKRIYE